MAQVGSHTAPGFEAALLTFRSQSTFSTMDMAKIAQQVKTTSASAMEKTRAFNDKYQISKTAHKLAADTSAKVSDLNEQHQVTEKAKTSTAAVIEKGREMD